MEKIRWLKFNGGMARLFSLLLNFVELRHHTIAELVRYLTMISVDTEQIN